MLPHTIGFIASATDALLDPVREIFGDRDAGRGLATFAVEVGAPRALRDLGMSEADLDRAAAPRRSVPPRVVNGSVQSGWRAACEKASAARRCVDAPRFSSSEGSRRAPVSYNSKYVSLAPRLEDWVAPGNA